MVSHGLDGWAVNVRSDKSYDNALVREGVWNLRNSQGRLVNRRGGLPSIDTTWSDRGWSKHQRNRPILTPVHHDRTRVLSNDEECHAHHHE